MGITAGAKSNATSQFCESVRTFSNSACALIEEAGQAAYLVGVSDPRSEPGRPALVDLAPVRQSHAAIEEACRVICDPATTANQVRRLAILSVA